MLIKNLQRNQNQFGFRSKRGTIDAIVSLIDKLGFTGMVNPSYHSARSKTWLKLLTRLTIIFCWINANHMDLEGLFLVYWNRDQQTENIMYIYREKKKSKVEGINFDIPRGSVLDPLLFTLNEWWRENKSPQQVATSYYMLMIQS